MARASLDPHWHPDWDDLFLRGHRSRRPDAVPDAAERQSPKLPGPGDQPAAVVAHTYELTDSEADLTKIPAATIVAENTAVHCEGGTGDLAEAITGTAFPAPAGNCPTETRVRADLRAWQTPLSAYSTRCDPDPKSDGPGPRFCVGERRLSARAIHPVILTPR